jgi:cobalt-zinc-cadmium resistance protein CzcA
MMRTIVLDTSIRHPRGGGADRAALVLVGGGFALRYGCPSTRCPTSPTCRCRCSPTRPGLSAEEIERFITRPVEMGLNGVPGLKEIRSITREGISTVTVIFDESTDVWFARQLVMERLRAVEADIPPQFGRPRWRRCPRASGRSTSSWCAARGAAHGAAHPPRLGDQPRGCAASPGIIEVNAFGGAKRQYQVVVDPARLAAHRVTLAQVIQALERNNVNVGGGYIERGAEQFVIRGEGQLPRP